jgi:O-antigen ligase
VHNGYIEVNLNLGWLGLGFIALILGGLWQDFSALRRDRALGALRVACVVAAVAYSIGEAGFRMLNPSWCFLLLTVVAASRAIGVDKRACRNHLSLSQASWRSELAIPLGANEGELRE